MCKGLYPSSLRENHLILWNKDQLSISSCNVKKIQWIYWNLAVFLTNLTYMKKNLWIPPRGSLIKSLLLFSPDLSVHGVKTLLKVWFTCECVYVCVNEQSVLLLLGSFTVFSGHTCMCGYECSILRINPERVRREWMVAMVMS